MNYLPLLVHLAVAVSSVLLISGVIRSRRPGPGGSVHDVAEAAFLGGGPGRTADATIAGMHADGRLSIGGPGIVAVQQSGTRGPVEQAVLQEHAVAPNGGLHTLRIAVMRSPAVQRTGNALAARGLLVPPAGSRPWIRRGNTQGVLCLIALPVSLIVAVLVAFPDSGSSEDSGPLFFSTLPSLLAGAFIGFVCASVAKRRLTDSGRRALRNFRTGIPTTAPADVLVAAHGLRGLPDPVLKEQLRVAARRPAGASSSGSPSDGSPVTWCSGAEPGSGCGGSGCGASSCGGGSSDGGGGGSSCGGGGGCGGSG
jgi:uncharacterized protein (TIGR04222 family)